MTLIKEKPEILVNTENVRSKHLSHKKKNEKICFTQKSNVADTLKNRVPNDFNYFPSSFETNKIIKNGQTSKFPADFSGSSTKSTDEEADECLNNFNGILESSNIISNEFFDVSNHSLTQCLFTKDKRSLMGERSLGNGETTTTSKPLTKKNREESTNVPKKIRSPKPIQHIIASTKNEKGSASIKTKYTSKINSDKLSSEEEYEKSNMVLREGFASKKHSSESDSKSKSIKIEDSDLFPKTQNDVNEDNKDILNQPDEPIKADISKEEKDSVIRKIRKPSEIPVKINRNVFKNKIKPVSNLSERPSTEPKSPKMVKVIKSEIDEIGLSETNAATKEQSTEEKKYEPKIAARMDKSLDMNDFKALLNIKSNSQEEATKPEESQSVSTSAIPSSHNLVDMSTTFNKAKALDLSKIKDTTFTVFSNSSTFQRLQSLHKQNVGNKENAFIESTSFSSSKLDTKFSSNHLKKSKRNPEKKTEHKKSKQSLKPKSDAPKTLVYSNSSCDFNNSVNKSINDLYFRPKSCKNNNPNSLNFLYEPHPSSSNFSIAKNNGSVEALSRLIKNYLDKSSNQDKNSVVECDLQKNEDFLFNDDYVSEAAEKEKKKLEITIKLSTETSPMDCSSVDSGKSDKPNEIMDNQKLETHEVSSTVGSNRESNMCLAPKTDLADETYQTIMTFDSSKSAARTVNNHSTKVIEAKKKKKLKLESEHRPKTCKRERFLSVNSDSLFSKTRQIDSKAKNSLKKTIKRNERIEKDLFEKVEAQNLSKRNSEPKNFKEYVWKQPHWAVFKMSNRSFPSVTSSLKHLNTDEVEDFKVWEPVPLKITSGWELSLYQSKRTWSLLSCSVFKNNQLLRKPGLILEYLKNGGLSYTSGSVLFNNQEMNVPEQTLFDVEPSIAQKNIDIANWLLALNFPTTSSTSTDTIFDVSVAPAPSNQLQMSERKKNIKIMKVSNKLRKLKDTRHWASGESNLIKFVRKRSGIFFTIDNIHLLTFVNPTSCKREIERRLTEVLNVPVGKKNVLNKVDQITSKKETLKQIAEEHRQQTTSETQTVVKESEDKKSEKEAEKLESTRAIVLNEEQEELSGTEKFNLNIWKYLFILSLCIIFYLSLGKRLIEEISQN